MARTRWIIAAGVAAALALATPAGAVFPGGTGRLVVANKLFDPPSATPLATYPFGTQRFSPDGLHVTGQTGSTTAVWVADADGSNPRQLTTPPSGAHGDQWPSWAPDGKSIVFVRSKKVSCGTTTCFAYELDSVDVASGALRTIIPLSTATFLSRPEYSPDGSQLLVTTVVVDRPTGISLVDPATGANHEIISGPNFGRWAPDGKHIVVAWSTIADGDPHSHVRVIDTSGATALDFRVAQPNMNVFPTFTPDGARLSLGDCRPDCGVWSAALPQDGSPLAWSEDLSLTAARDSSVEWEPLVDEPIITAGPTGTVARRDATFEFSVPSKQPGHYQCRLDGGGWVACTSPKRYTGLHDAEHTFDVRFYLDGQSPDDSPVTTRRWTSDTTAPDAIIDQAPSGTVTSTEATIAFHSTEPDGATFRCALDGGSERDCSSPQRMAGLGLGPHTFTVRAIDAVGNAQGSATPATWQIDEKQSSSSAPSTTNSGGTVTGPTTPPLPGTVACATGKVTAGVVVAVARGGTCFSRTKAKDGSTQYTATGPITLNGVQVTPAGGTKIVIDQRLSDVTVDYTGPVTLGFGSFSFTLPFAMHLPLGKAQTAARYVLKKGEFEVAGLKVGAAPTFDLSSDDGGTTKVGLKLELPSVFRGVAGDGKADSNKVGGLSFDWQFIASNDKGVRFAYRSAIQTAWLFGKVQLSDVGLAFDTGPPITFEGYGSLKFPEIGAGITKSNRTFTLNVALTKDGGAFPAVKKLSLQAAGLQTPLGEGFYLQRLGGEFARCKDGSGEVTASAGLSYGPHLDLGFFEGEPLSLDGSVIVSMCEPKRFEITGAGKIVEVPVSSASAKLLWTKRRLELSGKLDLTLGGYGFLASIEDSFWDVPGKVFDVDATGELRLPGWSGGVLDGQAEVALSSNGLAACFGSPSRRIGIAKHWGSELEKFADSCDVGPYRATGGARSAALGDAFTVRPHAGVEVVAVHGTDAPPKVLLTGPGGVRIDTPAGPEGLRTSRAIVTQDPAARTTYIVLLAPAAGTWTVSPEPLAAPPAGVQVADALAPVHVTGHVRRRGRRRVLRWHANAQPGQRVSFVERGAQTTRTLLTTGRSAGTLVFTPDRAPGRGRRIEAVVTQDGLPRTTLVVARFTAPAPARMRRIGRLRLSHGRLSWARQAAASRYSVMVSAGAASWTGTVSRPTVRLTGALRAARRVTVLVSGLDRTGEAGPLTRRTLKRR